MKKLFKNIHCLTPDPINPGGKLQVEWFFDNLTVDQIAVKDNGEYAVIPGCGCTADIQVLEDRIIATYTDQNTVESVSKEPNGEIQISKNLRVFLNDDKPLRKMNERGVMGWNVDEKLNIQLMFTVIVQV